MKQTTVPASRIVTWHLNSVRPAQEETAARVFARVSSFLFVTGSRPDLE